jgi:hypothetical protein
MYVVLPTPTSDLRLTECYQFAQIYGPEIGVFWLL